MTPAPRVPDQRSDAEIDEWVAVLRNPQAAAEVHATQGDRALAAWVRSLALSAACDLMRSEGGGAAGRSSLAQ